MLCKSDIIQHNRWDFIRQILKIQFHELRCLIRDRWEMTIYKLILSDQHQQNVDLEVSGGQ